MDPEQGDFENLKEHPGPANEEIVETVSEGGSGQVKMWPISNGRIVKTTDVRVSRDTEAVGLAGESMPEPDKTYDGTDLSSKALAI